MFAEDIKIDKKIPFCHSFSLLRKSVVTIVYIILIHKTTLLQHMWRKEKIDTLLYISVTFKYLFHR